MSRADFEFFESLDQLLLEQGIANEEAKAWLGYEVEEVPEPTPEQCRQSLGTESGESPTSAL